MKNIRRQTSGIIGRLEVILRRDWKLQYFRPKEEDELRALRLRQLEELYKVPLEWILAQLLPIWRKKFSRYQSGGLGVSMATLVGDKSEEIIRQRLKEEYPEQENEALWRSQQQQSQWQLFRDGIKKRDNWEDPVVAVRDYTARMNRERAARAEFERMARRRPYRGNPWI